MGGRMRGRSCWIIPERNGKEEEEELGEDDADGEVDSEGEIE